MKRAAVILSCLVAAGLAVPPRPGSWDLEAGVHLETGVPLPQMPPWVGPDENESPLPTPPVMGAVAV
ncbi:MAG TPA: hypothetical protein ENN88_02195, partial [Candidatus Coatesbacteria bacterium]|nr:hypothetical protein [Candidatus Coatesbacteria bacterium]